jgi:hypothetical protein
VNKYRVWDQDNDEESNATERESSTAELAAMSTAMMTATDSRKATTWATPTRPHRLSALGISQPVRCLGFESTASIAQRLQLTK